MLERAFLISKFSWFLPSSSAKAAVNSLECIKKLIQDLSSPKPRPVLKRKITAESWTSFMWGNLTYLFSSFKMRFFSPSTNASSQFKDLLGQEQVEKKTFIEYASNLFGQRLIKGVQKAVDSLPNVLKKNDLWHLFAMIGHKLTLTDLRDLLKRVNSGEIPLKLSRSISNDLTELSSQDMEKLVGFFRNPLEHLLPNEKKILWEELKNSGIPLDGRILANTEYEYHIRKLVENLEKEFTETDLKFLPFSTTEQLARVVAYAEPNTICKGMPISIPFFSEKQGTISYEFNDYQLDSHINEKGLHCYLFTPLKGDFPAQLVFRGTDDTDSLIRDVLDPKGIGKTVFDEYKNKIAKIIENYCNETKNPSLEIIGHSLGGLDAQRATAFCLELFNQENNNGPISRLSRINCFAFCSPKLDQATIKLWEEQVNILKNRPSSLQIGLNFGYHKNDIITQMGFKNLYTKEGLNFLHENHLQVISNSGILATLTHHREPFFEKGKFYASTDNREYIHYNSLAFVQLQEKIDFIQEQIDLIKEYSEIKTLLQKELEIVELSKQKLTEMKKDKEALASCQMGYSPDASWKSRMAYQFALAPYQILFHWAKSYYQEKKPSDASWKAFFTLDSIVTSSQRFSSWAKSHCHQEKQPSDVSWKSFFALDSIVTSSQRFSSRVRSRWIKV